MHTVLVIAILLVRKKIGVAVEWAGQVPAGRNAVRVGTGQDQGYRMQGTWAHDVVHDIY